MLFRSQQHVKIAPAPNLPENVRLALARLLPVALTSAVREIVSPVVERSVTIACMTSRELVLKDFAVEPDAARLVREACTGHERATEPSNPNAAQGLDCRCKLSPCARSAAEPSMLHSEGQAPDRLTKNQGMDGSSQRWHRS